MNVRCDDYTTPSTEKDIQVNNIEVLRVMKPGDVLYVNDGAVELIIRDHDIDSLKTEVRTGGHMKSYSTVKVLSTRYETMSPLSAEDKQDIKELAVAHNFDYVALPLTLTYKDLKQLRDLLDSEGGKDIGIIAKVDNAEAIHQYEQIIIHSDAIILVRNELKYELAPEKMMIAQQWLVEKTNREGKPMIL